MEQQQQQQEKEARDAPRTVGQLESNPDGESAGIGLGMARQLEPDWGMARQLESNRGMARQLE